MSELLLDLKGDLRSVAEVIGRQKALYLVSQSPKYKAEKRTGVGQLFLYVPQAARLKMDHNLVTMLGYDDAHKLCKVFGGELLVLSQCKHILIKSRNAGIKAMIEQGFKIDEVASFFNLSTRTIRTTAFT
ncbi:hypothetical protein AVENLUH5627_02473 [Acinetobacter venetianus]|uniref:Mor transcription activator domain-containing protein n=1 Tax=Acinetobacter venetianus TaxID=52133 RepID=A0A150HM30_9GAMM|nr:hypothetical protein [Acinetobacter venetianus]KXZ66779.1 hypothetical protein AVENLUH5627_02473 [Acinetobacter venetianus]